MSASEAKKSLKKMYGLCDSIDELPFGIAKASDNDMTTRKALMLEVLKFCMYLSAADGSVSYREAEYLEDLFDISMSPSQLTEFINENDVYSTEFEETVPLVLKLFVKTDNAVISTGGGDGKLISDLLIRFYEAVGEDFCKCDGVGGNERDDMNIYLRMMKRYVRDNVADTDNDSFMKQSSSCDNSLKSKYQILKKK